MSTSGLGALYDAVKADFAASDDAYSTTSVVFGTREVARQINQGTGLANRVVFEPLQSPVVAKLAPARMPGGNPPRILAGDVAATVYVWAYDGTTRGAAEDERSQYEAVRNLFIRTVQAIWRANAGQVTWGDVRKVNPDKRESVLGQEWAVTITTVDDFESTTDLEVIRDGTVETEFVFQSAGG